MDMVNAGQDGQEVRRPARRDDAALLTELARMMGLGEETARQFAGSGRLRLDDMEFALHADSGSDYPRKLIASATVPCPPELEPSAWHDALLVANEGAMIAGEWGFALEDDGAASLLMNVSDSMQTPACLRAMLEGMLGLCSTVREGALAKHASAGIAQ